jgi:hypothetical protein
MEKKNPRKTMYASPFKNPTPVGKITLKGKEIDIL